MISWNTAPWVWGVNSLLTLPLYILFSPLINFYFPVPVNTNYWILLIRGTGVLFIFSHGFIAMTRLNIHWINIFFVVFSIFFLTIGIEWFFGWFHNPFYAPILLAFDWFLATFIMWCYVS
jgi:hypothetical protein